MGGPKLIVPSARLEMGDPKFWSTSAGLWNANEAETDKPSMHTKNNTYFYHRNGVDPLGLKFAPNLEMGQRKKEFIFMLHDF